MMDFPTDIAQLVGYYVVETLFDLQLLVRSGFLVGHCNALRYTRLHFRDMNDAAVVNPQMFAGIRRISFQQFYHDCTNLAQLAPHLEELDLGQCQHLSGTHTLGLFSKLHTLSMTHCTKFTSVYGLRSLHLHDCSAIGGEFVTVEHLSLECCTIGKITKLNPNLQSLEMTQNTPYVDFSQWDERVSEFDENWYFDLSQLTSLTKLCICDVYLKNIHARKIKRMTRLGSLKLRNCSMLTDFAFMRHLKALRVLLVDSRFDWSTLEHLSLESFSSTWTPVHDLFWLSTQTGLTLLHLEPALYISRDPTPELCTLLPLLTKLRTLELRYWDLLRGELPVCPSVTRLSVEHCLTCTDQTLAWLMHSFPKVEALSVDYTKISNAGLGLLSDQLRELSVAGCAVTDVSGLRKFTHLTCVDLSFCEVERVDMLPKSLKTLKIESCSKLDPNSVLKLRRRRVKML